jgi:hypothetical protein
MTNVHNIDFYTKKALVEERGVDITIDTPKPHTGIPDPAPLVRGAVGLKKSGPFGYGQDFTHKVYTVIKKS